VASQKLAQQLLERGSLGIVYPSVRRKAGTCVACLRPALVMNVRKARSYRYVWKGRAEPEISGAVTYRPADTPRRVGRRRA